MWRGSLKPDHVTGTVLSISKGDAEIQGQLQAERSQADGLWKFDAATHPEPWSERRR